MITTTCNHRGCNASFTHPTQTKADSALRMHIGRKHKRHIKTGRTDLGAVDPKPKRRIKRTAQHDHQHGGLNYCPGCGMNLAMLAMALNVANNIKR